MSDGTWCVWCEYLAIKETRPRGPRRGRTRVCSAHVTYRVPSDHLRGRALNNDTDFQREQLLSLLDDHSAQLTRQLASRWRLCSE